mmetsp:Transcript_47384/g.47816  ORF Transcript_47384/g.47816 Transcript_47384/m.47816 type:complete len:105 (+) Transcript_47384:831-1145(+)
MMRNISRHLIQRRKIFGLLVQYLPQLRPPHCRFNKKPTLNNVVPLEPTAGPVKLCTECDEECFSRVKCRFRSLDTGLWSGIAEECNESSEGCYFCFPDSKCAMN